MGRAGYTNDPPVMLGADMVGTGDLVPKCGCCRTKCVYVRYLLCLLILETPLGPSCRRTTSRAFGRTDATPLRIRIARHVGALFLVAYSATLTTKRQPALAVCAAT